MAKKCPNCGACPECGARPPYVVQPWVYPYVPSAYPNPYVYPRVTWGSGFQSGGSNPNQSGMSGGPYRVTNAIAVH